MEEGNMRNYIKDVLENMPADWLSLTTHRLDIYDEELAKTQFLNEFEILFKNNNSESSALSALPTANDYIRLGHPLSCILEWGIAKVHGINPDKVISFSSKTTPVLAILRKNLLDNKNTQILYTGDLPESFDVETVKQVYSYQFELRKVEKASDISNFEGSTVFISEDKELENMVLISTIDFYIIIHEELGSVLLVNGKQNERYISQAQHVRRRETIAMKPANSLTSLKLLI